MKTIKQSYKKLYDSKDNLVKELSYIERVGFSTKWQVKKILKKSKDWEKIDTYITLCPFYDWKGWIKWGYNNFEEVWIRYKNKLQASLEVINLLKDFFNLKLNFILANQMVLVDSNYNIDKFDKDIRWSLELYNKKIKDSLSNQDFFIWTFGDIWLQLNTFCNVEKEKNEEDIMWILKDFWVDYEKFKFSLQIIINSFWISWAYYLIKWYLEETKQLLEIFKENIIINTEAIWPLNTLYTAWSCKLNSQNMLVKIKI